MRRSVLFLGFIIIVLTPRSLFAQSIKALQRQAKHELKQQQYAAAAAKFERAARLKNNDHLLFSRAAAAYQQARDYFNAANCYSLIATDPRFPLSGLNYARSLKQQGLFREAQQAFTKAAEHYTGDQRAILLQVIENELAGCTLAETLFAGKDEKAESASISRVFPKLSNPENHFAPLPFSDTLLYYSVAGGRASQLMRSAKIAGIWQPPKLAEGLPENASVNFLCGAFSTDAKRFYFTRCEIAPAANYGSSVDIDRCAIYVLQRNSAGDWGAPEPLPDYINLKGSSSMWPFVCDYGGEEWLFFCSNRPGGMGGIDLYFARRALSSDALDFTFPQNLGIKINTGADETTPYYDVFTKTLWFSSMGHPGLGGQDIHKAIGAYSQWSTPINAGIPINSPADDFYFVLKQDGTGAFLSSNRNQAMNDNLFEIWFRQ